MYRAKATSSAAPVVAIYGDEGGKTMAGKTR
jgi:hypothetical protein